MPMQVAQNETGATYNIDWF